MSSILIRVPNWLGDSIMARPFVASLAARSRDSRLTIVAHRRVADLWRAWPDLDVMELPLGEHRPMQLVRLARRLRHSGPHASGYLLTASFASALLFVLAGVRERSGFAGDGRSWLLTRPVERIRPVGVTHYSAEYLNLLPGGSHTDSVSPSPPEYRWPPAASVTVEERLAREGLTDKVFAVIAVGASGGAKRYTPAAWRRVLEIIGERCPAVLVGTAAERQLAMHCTDGLGGPLIDWCGQTSLPELACLLRRAAVFAGVDSGAAHLAASVGCPSVVIFGPGDPIETAPEGGRVIVLREPLWCAPCRSRRCLRSDHPSECMDKVAPERVAEALEALLAGKTAPPA